MPVNKDFYTLAGSSGQSTGYEIDQSIRFNYGDSPYMYRSPSSTGNRKKFTNSFWYKRGAKIGDYQALPSVHTTESGGSYGMYLSTANVLQVFTYYSGSWAGLHYSNRVFRDVSAWYHFVWAVDTTHNVATERVRIFVNGERITDWSSESYPSQNQDLSFNNSGEQHNVGKDANGSYYVDGYGSEMHYIDGYSYGPEYFGEFDDSNNWIPKEYTGSYGTNGFYIKGSNSGSLGTDSSGNGNNLTVSGLAAHDQVEDSPTNNFTVINPLVRSNNTHSEGNLKIVCTTSTPAKFVSTIGVTSGKWYMEFRHNADNNFTVGITKDNQERDYLGGSDSSTSVSFWPGTAAGSGQTALFVNNSSLSWDGSSTTWSAGDFIGLALNADDSIIAIYKNGSSLGSYDYSALNWTTTFFAGGNYVSSTYIANFGQEGTFAGATTAGGNSDGSGVGNFKYSVPAGYKALCTKNLFSVGG